MTDSSSTPTARTPVDLDQINVILATDCGSTTTKAILIEKVDGEYRQTFRGEAPTTVEDPAAAFDQLTTLFEARYTSLFSISTPGAPLEIVNWKVEATGPDAGLQSGYQMVGIDAAGTTALKGTRRAWFGADAYECAVYDRYSLTAGWTVKGPAIVEERESTCVIGPGETARVDAAGNLIAELVETLRM